VLAGLAILLLTGAGEWPEGRSLEAVLIVQSLPGERIRVIADVPGKKRVETTFKVEADGKFTVSNENSHKKVILSSLWLDLPDEKSPPLEPLSLEEELREALPYANESYPGKHGEVWPAASSAQRSGESWFVTLFRPVEGGGKIICISVDRNRKCHCWGGGGSL
jgi:hypothetical protein